MGLFGWLFRRKRKQLRYDLRNLDDKSKLVIAARSSDLTMVKSLLSNGADPDARMDRPDFGETAFAYAAQYGDVQLAKLLLKYGADINRSCECDDDGASPLQVAVLHEHLELVRYLIDHGADVNQRSVGNGAVALHAAGLKKDLAYTELLLSKGANPNVLDNYGNTPLSYASQKGHDAIASLLRRHGATK